MSVLTIPMPEIITRLAAKVNCGDETAGAFLKEFSIVVTQGLAADGVVRIEGLGTFKVTADVDGKPTVDFAPEASLAETVNAPFAMFESVELADSLTDEELESSGQSDSSGRYVAEDAVLSGDGESSEKEVASEKEEAPESGESPLMDDTTAAPVIPPPVPPRFSSARHTIEHPDTAAVSAPAPVPVSAPVPDSVPTPAQEPEHHQPAPAVYDAPVPVRLEPESRVTIKRMGHTTLTLVVTAIAACLLGLVIGYLAYRYANFGLPGNVEVLEDGILIRHDSRTSDDMVAEEIIPFDNADDDSLDVAAVDESVAAPDTTAVGLGISSADSMSAAAPKEVTDTVKPGNYLSVMARRHYGNAKFWVYIYIENKDRIRNPDNLEDGMVLVIPPADKYDIDPSSKESLAKAEREAYKAMPE